MFVHLKFFFNKCHLSPRGGGIKADMSAKNVIFLDGSPKSIMQCSVSLFL